MQAQGVLLEWGDVPDHVRNEVASLLMSPVVLAENQPGGFSTFDGYRRLAGDERAATGGLDDWTLRHLDHLARLELGWELAVVGDSLVHSDIRADNLLVTPDGSIVFVDWPHAFVGAAWLDKLFLLPSVGLDRGPTPAEVEATLDPLRGVDPDQINSVLVALCGYFTHRGCQPDPPGLPTVRPFQRAQGDVTRSWLASRLGWR